VDPVPSTKGSGDPARSQFRSVDKPMFFSLFSNSFQTWRLKSLYRCQRR